MNEDDKRDFKSLFLFFVENGANINAKDKDGETPADLLRQRGIDITRII